MSILVTSFALETFKALYAYFLTDGIKCVGELVKFKRSNVTLKSCFTRALSKVLKKHEIKDEVDFKNDQQKLFVCGNVSVENLLKGDGLTKELYNNYLRELSKHFWLCGMVKLHLLSLSTALTQEINSKLSTLIVQFKSGEKFLNEAYLNNGLGADITIVQSERKPEHYNQHIILRSEVYKLGEIAKNCKVLFLYGEKLIGKSILAEQIAETFKDKTKSCLNLHYKEEGNAIEFVHQHNKKNDVVIIDNLNTSFGNEYAERIFHFLLSLPHDSITIVTGNEDISDLLTSISLDGLIKYEVKPFQNSEVEKIAETYGMPRDSKLLNMLESMSKHPLLVRAYCEQCCQNQWKIVPTLYQLFAYKGSNQLNSYLVKIIKEVIPDENTRNLLARINLIRLSHPTQEMITVLANVKPPISGYMERLNALMPSWIRIEKGSYVLNDLLHYWTFGLLTSEKNSCYLSISKFMLEKKTVNTLEVFQVITYLSNGGAYNDAGILLANSLAKAKEQNLPSESLYYNLIWIDLPLPEKMSPNVKDIVRISQIISPYTDKKYYPFLVNNILRILQSGGVNPLLKKSSYFLLSMFSSSYLNNIKLGGECFDRAMECDSNLPYQESLKPVYDSLNSESKKIVNFFLMKSDDVENYREYLKKGAGELNLSLCYSFSCHIMGEICGRYGEKPPVWKEVLEEMRKYYDASFEYKRTNLSLAFAIQILLISGQHLQDPVLIKCYYTNFLKQNLGEVSKSGLDYAVGYGNDTLKDYHTAKDYLLSAYQNAKQLPSDIRNEILLLLSFIEAHDSRKDKQLKYIDELNINQNKEPNDIQMAKYYGEATIAYWDSDKLVSEKNMEKCLEIILQYYHTDSENILYKMMLTKAGCCIGQMFTYVNKNHYEDKFLVPFPGLFTECNSEVFYKGDFSNKEFSVVFQMYQLNLLLKSGGAETWAEKLIDLADKLKCDTSLVRAISMLSISFIVKNDYHTLEKIINIVLISYQNKLPSDAPKIKRIDSFFFFFIIPMMISYESEVLENGSSNILLNHILPILKKADSIFEDQNCRQQFLDVLEGNVLHNKVNSNPNISTTFDLLKLQKEDPLHSFLILYHVVSYVECIFSQMADYDVLLSRLSSSLLKYEMKKFPDQLEINLIQTKGLNYINQTVDFKYKAVAKVFYNAIKDISHLTPKENNSLLAWLGY